MKLEDFKEAVRNKDIKLIISYIEENNTKNLSNEQIVKGVQFAMRTPLIDFMCKTALDYYEGKFNITNVLDLKGNVIKWAI